MFVCTEADFVGSVLLKESINSSIGDDDKIYFFFTERSQEQIAYPSQTKVSRVARVCKVRVQNSAQLSSHNHIRDFSGSSKKNKRFSVPARSWKERDDMTDG